MAKPKPQKKINISDLKDRKKTGIPSGTGAFLAEISIVCLENEEHTSGIKMAVNYDNEDQGCVLFWHDPESEFSRFFHKDLDEATQFGATGIAILLIKTLTPFKVVQRSYKTTGIDYWLVSKKSLIFQKAARLEISGNRREKRSSYQSRVTQKIEQTKQSDSTDLPAFIVVVEFSTPKARMVSR